MQNWWFNNAANRTLINVTTNDMLTFQRLNYFKSLKVFLQSLSVLIFKNISHHLSSYYSKQ